MPKILEKILLFILLNLILILMPHGIYIIPVVWVLALIFMIRYIFKGDKDKDKKD